MQVEEDQVQQAARRLRRLVAAWAGIGMLTAVAVAVAFGDSWSPMPSPWLLAAIWVGMALAGVAFIHLTYGRVREAVSPIEVAAVLAITLLPPPWAVLVALTSVAASEAVLTRGSVPKVLFNTGWRVTGVAVGSVVFTAIAQPGAEQLWFSATPRDILAAVLAVPIVVLANSVALVGLGAALSGEPWRSQIDRELVSHIPLNLGMGMTGVVAAVLAVTAPAALPLLAVPTAMDYLRAKARQEELELELARTQAEAASTAKSVFLSHMSHELRTPLTAILGFGQLLEHSDLGPMETTATTHILSAGRHLQSLIDDVLDLTQIEAGFMTLAADEVDLTDLIDDAVALIQPIADERSVRVVVAVECDPIVLSTDRRRCRQILLNLLSNAVKYNHEGGDVTVRCDLRGGDHVRLSVHDTGPGIDPALQSQLFEPFNRLGAETSGVKGTGLGLALTKQLVQAMGGAIGVEAGLGEGSTFWVDLPLTAPDPGRSAAS